LEWAETLVGLRLNIPNKWWPGFRNGGLNRGKIAAITLDPSSSYYFQVELDHVIAPAALPVLVGIVSCNFLVLLLLCILWRVAISDTSSSPLVHHCTRM
jgi:hypothetical protein